MLLGKYAVLSISSVAIIRYFFHDKMVTIKNSVLSSLPRPSQEHVIENVILKANQTDLTCYFRTSAIRGKNGEKKSLKLRLEIKKYAQNDHSGVEKYALESGQVGSPVCLSLPPSPMKLLMPLSILSSQHIVFSSLCLCLSSILT